MKQLKLDENKNPFLPNKQMLNFFRNKTHIISDYPSINNELIETQISQTFAIDKSYTMFGNGSMDLFNKLVNSFGDVSYGIIAPSFWGFKHFLYLNNYKKWNHLQLTDNNEIDLDNLNKLSKKCSVIYLCNTNNPTLQYFNKKSLINIIQKNPNCHFIIDETLLTFEDFYSKSLFQYCKKYNNLTIVISMSKIFGIAGLRMGILFSNENLITKLKLTQIPFVTNNLTEKFAIEFLPYFNKLDKIKTKIYDNFKYLEKNVYKKYIISIKNINSSFVNIFIDYKIDLHKLKDYLDSYHILIRYSFELDGTYANFIRISAGTKKQYKKFIFYFNKYFRGI